MRKLYFLLPGTTDKFGGGGLWAELKIIELARQICPAQIVTYRQRESNSLFLTDILESKNLNLENCIFVVSWGFDVPKLVTKLKNYNLIYHAHSAGYSFSLPPDIPIVSVSRNSMGYWGQKSPNALIYYLPNQIGDEFCNLGKPRDIDVLVQARKSSQYLLQQLVPALRCRVELLDGYVEDLAGLFNRSKIYLYDSAEYWAVSGVTEGFGLPPLEALACGCQVFSSVNNALADYLDPGFNCYKIAGYSLEYDVQRILAVLDSPTSKELPDSFFAEYRTENITKRLQVILTEINTFFDRRKILDSDIEGLSFWRKNKLLLKRSLTRVQKKI